MRRKSDNSKAMERWSKRLGVSKLALAQCRNDLKNETHEYLIFLPPFDGGWGRPPLPFSPETGAKKKKEMDS